MIKNKQASAKIAFKGFKSIQNIKVPPINLQFNSKHVFSFTNQKSSPLNKSKG